MSPSRNAQHKDRRKKQRNPEASYEQLWSFFVAAAVTAFALQQFISPKDIAVQFLRRDPVKLSINQSTEPDSAPQQVSQRPELPFVK